MRRLTTNARGFRVEMLERREAPSGGAITRPFGTFPSIQKPGRVTVSPAYVKEFTPASLAIDKAGWPIGG